MKAKFTLDPTKLGNILQDYKEQVEHTALTHMEEIMFEPVVEESVKYAPFRKGGFVEELTTFRIAYPVGEGRFITDVVIDPYEPSQSESEYLDRIYYQMTGEEIETRQEYGKHSYYNSFSGVSDFFRISLPQALPFIKREMTSFLVRR